MTATKEQKKAIRKNCDYDVNIKEELVQWATDDNKKTSLNDLSFEQANKILVSQGVNPEPVANWGVFDKYNGKHKYILSLCFQLGLVKEYKGRDVADMFQLGEWLKSNRSPVKKPLNRMTPFEVSKIIGALEKMVEKKWK